MLKPKAKVKQKAPDHAKCCCPLRASKLRGLITPASDSTRKFEFAAHWRPELSRSRAQPSFAERNEDAGVDGEIGRVPMEGSIMRLLTALVFSGFTTVALAQGTPAPATNAPQNRGVSPSSTNNSDKPVAGANSFTEAEAKSHIEAKGYTNVSALTKDKDGIWRGTASKEGKTGEVSLDYQGNVFGK